MHSSYQLNTVFTDVFFFLPYTPTELQVSSSCNMTNQPLFLRNNPAAVEPVLHGASGLEEPERLRGRKGADGRRVCLQLGCIFYFFIFIGGDRKQTTQSIIHQRAQCSNSVAYVSFVRIPKRWRLSCLSHQIWSWSNNINVQLKTKKEKKSHLFGIALVVDRVEE